MFALVTLLLVAPAARAQKAPQINPDYVEVIKFPSLDENSTRITGFLVKPFGVGPFAGTHAAVVAMHGCGGLFKAVNGKPSKKMVDWARRLNAAGYVVLFPDSFASRGLGSICHMKNRPVSEKQRARDAEGAAEWLAGQNYIYPERIALLGWSNGGTAVLWATEPNRPQTSVKFMTAIAFYPTCRILESTNWKPEVPLTILIGREDDWDPPEPCERLAKRWQVKIHVYEGAYHSFDHPSAERQLRSGLTMSKRGDGLAIAGTDPVARQDAIEEVMSLLKEAQAR
jgi:dienelactone hydrolase